MTIFICAVVTLLTLVYVFYLPGELYLGPEKTRAAYLRERKDAVYENLRDLQFEYRVGKLSDQDYQQTKQDLQKELAGVLAEIDRLKQTLATPPPVPKPAKKTPQRYICPSCKAEFPTPLKFCGECGKPMAAAQA